MSSHPSFPGTPAITGALSLANATGTSLVDFYTASPGGNGVMCGRLRAASSDTNAVTLQFARSIGGTDYIIGESQVPAGSGTNGTAVWKDLLADLNLGNAMTLSPGEKLRVRAKTAVTATLKIDLIMEGAPL
ncbi:hypothetical protein [Fundidesulfovibrio terrae]|uniref:hypothetical protein n=1 Tax=Fundidesulfovibrio terrae TaxID=2922866 RepID=UPI001FAFBC57|nr:hypothetical protein [Fundidesulfovibrio terrae]